VSIGDFLDSLVNHAARYPLARSALARLMSIVPTPGRDGLPLVDPATTGGPSATLFGDLRVDLLRSVGSGPQGADGLHIVTWAHIHQVVTGTGPRLTGAHVHALIRHRRGKGGAAHGGTHPSTLTCLDDTVARLRSVVLAEPAPGSSSPARSPRLPDAEPGSTPSPLEVLAISKVRARIDVMA
jgi:hypothetical protein